MTSGEYSRIPTVDPGEKGNGVKAATAGKKTRQIPEDSCREWVGETFVKGTRFQSFVALVILANAIIIGCETDVPEKAWLWDRFEDTFLFIFLAELLLRLFYHRLYFFIRAGERMANWFDFTLVGAGVVDFAMTYCFHGSLGHFTTFIRLCRLLRILRLFRLFKMFKQLYMLASGFVDSSVAVFWVSVLCALCLYVCAVFLTRTLGRFHSDGVDSSFYREKFGSVAISMFTLFELMTDPNLADMKAAMFADPFIMAFFIVFIVFGSFAMLSILTGVISQGMIEKGNTHKEEMRFEEERSKQKFIKKLRQYFKDADADGDGTMTLDEFQKNLHSLVDMIAESGFSYSETDLQMVFGLVDFDKSGTVEQEEFLSGMTSFAANVSDLPLQILRLQSNIFFNLSMLDQKVAKTLDGCDARFVAAESTMQSIEQKIQTLAELQGRGQQS